MKASKKHKSQDSQFRSLAQRVKKWKLLPPEEKPRPGTFVGFVTTDCYRPDHEPVYEGFLIKLRPGAEGPCLMIAPVCSRSDIFGDIELYPVEFKNVVWMDNHRKVDIPTLMTDKNQYIRQIGKAMYDKEE